MDPFKDSTVPGIRRFVGRATWAANSVRQVVNHGELFARDITPLGLDRGKNALWTKGGWRFAPRPR